MAQWRFLWAPSTIATWEDVDHLCCGRPLRKRHWGVAGGPNLDSGQVVSRQCRIPDLKDVELHELFDALGDHVRLRVFETLLHEEEMTCGALEERI